MLLLMGRRGDKNQKCDIFLPNFLSARAGEEQRLTANAARRTGQHTESIALSCLRFAFTALH